MSDRIKDLSKQYEEAVLPVAEEHSRSLGLFTIPEYPELEVGQGMWSAALDVILTTLRYLAPATILTLFWGQQSFIFRLLKHIDAAIRSIVFSSEEQKQDVLRWLAESGPVRVDELDVVWRQGWILCGVLDAALPGACAGHPHTKLTLKHAQAIADHYLGVEPVFSRQELESNDTLGKHQEWKLATYLDRIRQALAKLTPPVSKPSSQRTSPETTHVTLDYVAKGSGLSVAQVNNKMYFKVYPTSQQCLDPGEITILIRGPKDTYGMTILPPIPGKAQMIRLKVLGLQTKTNYTENVLPLTQGATYLRTYGKNDMNKTYYIPKEVYDIVIEVESKPDHAKIGYSVKYEGTYEISITSRGQNIVGSPFIIKASKNIIGILEQESLHLDDGEEIDIVDVKTNKKVVLRIVDFVTEKMLLKENGQLEKISDVEAKILMATDTIEENIANKNKTSTALDTNDIKEMLSKTSKFRDTVKKITTMWKVCSAFKIILENKRLKSEKNKATPSKNRQDIPDIVNSIIQHKKSNTFYKEKINPSNSENTNSTNILKRDKFIIPENISVSIRTEKPMPVSKEVVSVCSANTTQETILEDISSDMRPSSTNPFINEIYKQNYKTEKDLGSFVSTEYETNNSQQEETHQTLVKILIEDQDMASTNNNNPFMRPDVISLERPKTPVLKIISGEVKNRDDSVYINPRSEQITEESLDNEFINPFFVHQRYQVNDEEKSSLTADFIIGAPVTLPPIMKSTTPEPNVESLIRTSNGQNLHLHETTPRNIKDVMKVRDFFYSSALDPNISVKDQSLERPVASLYSFESSMTEDNMTAIKADKDETITSVELETNFSPKKDTWDSAYVSIDDNNSSPDTNNNNDNTLLFETPIKPKLTDNENAYILKDEELSHMGPAEREIWESELNKDLSKSIDDPRFLKWDIKRTVFTPIIEENDRSISSGKGSIKQVTCNTEDSDPISVAFAELNDIYHEYYPNSEKTSANNTKQISNHNMRTNSMDCYIQNEKKNVDSASEYKTDVMRQTNEPGGTISEVQPNVTESASVSQNLHVTKNEKNFSFGYNIDETQFGVNKSINIVQQQKKYWDDKIRQIQAKTEEFKTQKKKRTFSKSLKHNDSLSRKRGKQIVKNFLNAESIETSMPATAITNEDTASSTAKEDFVTQKQTIEQNSIKEPETDRKFVEKWKKYWDEKLETENKEISKSSTKTNSSTIYDTYMPKCKSITEIKSEDSFGQSYPVKHELSEEVFRAFETSPKRFFGTSRKQILNKIDSFLGKPATGSSSTFNHNNLNHDIGLVSSRISLFHNITKTEELPLTRRKCQSLQNIPKRKNHNNSTESLNLSTTNVKETFIKKYTNEFNQQIKKIEYSQGNKDPDEPELEDKTTISIIKINKQNFDESSYLNTRQNVYTKRFREYKNISPEKPKLNVIRKTSISKSEMDIFNKTSKKSANSELEKYKSCEELPKNNVKNFVSMYENVSKAALESSSLRKGSRKDSTGSTNSYHSSHSGAVNKTSYTAFPHHSTPERRIEIKNNLPKISKKKTNIRSIDKDSYVSTDTDTSFESADLEIVTNKELKDITYLSLSDIELEIIERTSDKSIESSPERDTETIHRDYKSRFQLAKQYFQSLEELRDEKKPSKLNECELLLYNKKTNESPAKELPHKKIRKVKSHSTPSSEITKIWNQFQENQDNSKNESKREKISEKFNVDDLYNDVMEGRLSRQGSLRGIPHKKAVLETFRSMDNVSDSKLSSYDITSSQENKFEIDNKMPKNAQTFLSEYPYLPTTDPSKYHSRLDTKASGLISMKELMSSKPRRNSVPDLRLNPTFTVNL